MYTLIIVNVYLKIFNELIGCRFKVYQRTFILLINILNN
jgi:hypothetical protein